MMPIAEILSPKDYDRIFTNFSEILELTRSLCKYMVEAVKLFEGITKQLVPIGYLFFNFSKSFKSYKIYCNNQETCVMTITKCRMNDSDFNDFCKV